MNLKDHFEQISKSHDYEEIQELSSKGLDYMQANELTSTFYLAWSSFFKTIQYCSEIEAPHFQIHNLAQIAIDNIHANNLDI